MRKMFKLAVCITLGAGILHSPLTIKTQNTDVAKQLSQIEQRIAKAVVESDIETYNSILASDWTSIDLTGRVLSKSQVIEELASKVRQIESATIDDIRVREFGDVAVVTGRTTATGRYRGQRTRVVLRFTDVFAKIDGRWQVVASQGTQVAK
jgi:ketosteroid isomerase-like protein